ncbi:hypothetical protein [Mariniblastus fucicola]|uniref:Uncharacterized protein n=1 Tax=Mariniblastus fucicola TaxID=980251 RepID=A0A5B9PFC0_9BACT|nr:hypothetical protein [Mariniblastus fucicola]QEG23895.1 hypothetical protein MFFC18_37990 [Mariniblastus fucicola]
MKSTQFKFNQSDMAQILGKPSIWLRDNPAPRMDCGAYDAAIVIPWFLAKLDPDNSAQQRAEEIALLKSRIRKVELANDSIQRSAVSVVQVVELRRYIIDRLTGVLERFKKIESLPGIEFQKMVNNELREIDAELSAEGTGQ